MRSIFSLFLFLFNFTAGVEKDRFKQTLLLSKGDLLFLKQQTRRKTLQICSSTHTHKRKTQRFCTLGARGEAAPGGGAGRGGSTEGSRGSGAAVPPAAGKCRPAGGSGRPPALSWERWLCLLELSLLGAFHAGWGFACSGVGVLYP